MQEEIQGAANYVICDQYAPSVTLQGPQASIMWVFFQVSEAGGFLG